MPTDESDPYQLLVEGDDDKYSLIHLLDRNKIESPHVRTGKGIQGVLKDFPLLLKGPYSRVGCVVDANSSLHNRWEQLRNKATEAGVSLPVSPDPAGTVIEGRLPGSRVGVWLMPDNSSSGSLEDFLMDLIPEEDAPWLYSEDAVQEARRLGAPCLPKDHLKSRLHTWLAWQETPGLRFGTALRAEVLRSDSGLAQRFVDWFRRLFLD
jgi:hypothetical protein